MKRDFKQHIALVDKKAKSAFVGCNLPSFYSEYNWVSPFRE